MKNCWQLKAVRVEDILMQSNICLFGQSEAWCGVVWAGLQYNTMIDPLLSIMNIIITVSLLTTLSTSTQPRSSLSFVSPGQTQTQNTYGKILKIH